jgi:hypothetical protein
MLGFAPVHCAGTPDQTKYSWPLIVTTLPSMPHQLLAPKIMPRYVYGPSGSVPALSATWTRCASISPDPAE